MLDILKFMGPPFMACVILTGIHVYFGLHVIRRGIIFVDLSLAQVSALGASIALLFGIPLYSFSSKMFAILFALIGATIFSITRMRESKIPQEAIIGIVYAVATSLAIIVLDKTPQGAEHVKEMLTGTLLWIKWKKVFEIGVIYSCIGLFHYFMHRRFLLISDALEEAEKKGYPIVFYDFLFYATFGIVVTSSVEVAGVILVFSFLIIPTTISMLISEKFKNQLLWGYLIGTVVSALSLYLSYVFDLSSGPLVVTIFGFTLILTVILKRLKLI